ncbi:MAG: amino acid adenylation domain-containing protein, partial [bacterium]|nr:amino acid adenylation domain-containing protein [bacterium]
KEFHTLYSGAPLAPLVLQYKDYSEWQNSESQQELLKNQSTFWLEQFNGDIPLLKLPTDYARPVLQRFDGRNIRFILGADVTARLKALAASENATLFMVLLALFNLLLFKLSGQEDIVIGTGVAGRRHQDLEHIIGIFVNTLCIRNYPTPEKLFSDFIQEAKTHTLACFENQEYPFEDLVEQLDIPRDTGRNPLFDVMFMLQNFGSKSAAVEDNQSTNQSANQSRGIGATARKFESNVSKFDMTIIAEEFSDKLTVYWEYSTSLFKPETVDEFVRYFHEITASVSANSQAPLSSHIKISEKRKEIILHQLNSQLRDQAAAFIDSTGNKTLEQTLSDRFKIFNTNTAIEYGVRSLTYTQLDQVSDRVADWIADAGIPPGTLIGILIKDRCTLIATLIGILKARCIFVPMDSAYPQSRLESMMTTAKIGFMITDSGTAANGGWASILAGTPRFLSIEGESDIVLIGDSGTTAVEDDSLYVYFTSGTTGMPQAILGKDRSLLHFIHWEIDAFDINENYRISQLTTPVFDAFLRDIFVPLCAGGAICIPPDRDIITDARQFSQWLEQEEINLVHCVPGVFRVLTSSDALEMNGFKKLKYILLSGEPVFPQDLEQWYNKVGEGVQLANLYGPTETTLIKTSYHIQPSDIYRERIPVGTPHPGSCVVVLDENLEICDQLVTGELYIKTPFRSAGYLNNSQLNSRLFIADPFTKDLEGSKKGDKTEGDGHQFDEAIQLYKTGDLGRILLNGNIDILGRVDRQVKIRGARVELGEVETVLIKHPSVLEAVAVKIDISKEKHTSNAILCVYITTSSALTTTNKEEVDNIKKYIALRLPSYMVPDQLIKIEEIPRKPNGKVDYDSLPNPLREEETAFQPPRDQLEIKLAELWGGILGLEKIDVNLDFFESGGNSLNLLALISRIHKALNVRIGLDDIFNNPTISKQAALIRAAAPDRFSPVVPVEEKDYYVVSPTQKRLYLLHRLQPESTGYNITQAVSFDGAADIKQLETVFQKLIHRHESLRTSFDMIGDSPVQRIHREVDFSIRYLNPEPEPQETIKEFIHAFDLSHAPLLRVGVIEETSKRHILIVDIHHIICDGVSQQLLIKEFTRLLGSPEATPSQLPVQYKDFAEWQVTRLDLQDNKSSRFSWKAWWLKQLDGEIPVLNLPYDFPRPAVQNFEGNTLGFEINKEEARALNALALKENATLYMTLIALFNILLSKLSGQEDIIVGIPAAGRSHADLHRIIGMFVNTLVIRNYPKLSLTFLEFLQQVKAINLEAFENQDYPFEELVEQVVVRRDPSRNPLFDVDFTMHNLSLEAQTGIDRETVFPGNSPALRVAAYDYEITVSKFDLTLHAFESPSKLSFSFEYCTKLFKAEAIARFSQYYKTIASAVIENPGVKLADIEILTDKEKHYLLDQLNDTSADYPKTKTIHQLFTEQVDRTPEHIAVSMALSDSGHDPGHSQYATYRELNETSNRLASLLNQKGVSSETIAAIMLHPSLEMIIGILGILKAGGAYLPIDPDYPEARIHYMLADSGTKALLSTGALIEDVETLKRLEDNKTIAIIDVNAFETPPADSTVQPLDVSTSPSGLAYIIYTSGTTGNPKGVLIEHKSVVRLMFTDKFQFDFRSDDVWTMFHAYNFDFSVWEMYGALLYGGKLLLIPKMTRRDSRQFIDVLKTEKVTILNQVPSAFYNLMSEESGRISEASEKTEPPLQLRYIVFGGEALKPTVLKEWKEKYPDTKLINMFGITETTVHVTYKEIRSPEIREGVGNIGRPIPTTTALVVDDNLKLVPPGVEGQLCVGGDGVARGYLNQPELTSEKFVKNPYDPSEGKIYKSGDMVKLTHSGDMEYIGRTDHQVQLRGFRIELGEIENKLLQINKIQKAVVINKENNSGDTILCAYLVADKELNRELAVSELREYLNGKLPDYMIPGYFMYLEEIPLTPNGKVDRNCLPEPEVTSTEEYITPRNRLEEQMVEIWKHSLNLEQLGVEDNFFNLGGDSIKAIRLVSAINKQLNTSIRLVDLFTHNTIRELAQIKNSEIPDNHEKELEEVQKEVAELKAKIMTSDNMPGDVEDIFPMSDI